MGDPVTSTIITLGATYWQKEEAEKEAKKAEQRQATLERKAELTAEAQRQADLAEKRRQQDLLPPIIGSQTLVSELGISALETQEDITEEDIGIQLGTEETTGNNL